MLFKFDFDETVPEGKELRLDKIVIDHLASKNQVLNKKVVQDLIHHGKCTVNRKIERFSSYKVKTGDKIEFYCPDNIQELIVQKKESKLQQKLDVLFEDDHLMVINKSSGINFEDFATHSKIKLYPVHRLDKETSGVMILAKTQEAAAALIKQFSDRIVQKTYLAVCKETNQKSPIYQTNEFNKKSSYTPFSIIAYPLGTIALFQGHEKQGYNPEGKEAVTQWKVNERWKDNCCLVEIKPKTGRKHQIRVHLADIGYPILGDSFYGPLSSAKMAKRILLHASKIMFHHPLTQQVITIESKLPPEFNIYAK